MLHSIRTVVASLLILQSGGSVAQEADAGEKVFRKCASCHQVGVDAKSRVGPVLNGIVGAAAGQVEGFRYSNAMLESGITWDEETLSSFLRNPKEVVPKTKMVFAGIKKDEEVADVIGYLASFTVDGTRN